MFENIKDAIYEGTEKASLPIVDALFSEMTVLGFLSMVTFIVASAGFLTDISKVVFGETEKGEGYLKELFEQAHYMLFLVMVVFFFIAIYILAINNATMARLHDLRDRVLRPEWFSSQFDIASQPRPSWWCGGAKRREHNDACDFLEYMSMRREFIHGRKGELPHGQLPLKDWLPLDYNYAKYDREEALLSTAPCGEAALRGHGLRFAGSQAQGKVQGEFLRWLSGLCLSVSLSSALAAGTSPSSSARPSPRLSTWTRGRGSSFGSSTYVSTSSRWRTRPRGPRPSWRAPRGWR